MVFMSLAKVNRDILNTPFQLEALPSLRYCKYLRIVQNERGFRGSSSSAFNHSFDVRSSMCGNIGRAKPFMLITLLIIDDYSTQDWQNRHQGTCRSLKEMQWVLFYQTNAPNIRYHPMNPQNG